MEICSGSITRPVIVTYGKVWRCSVHDVWRGGTAVFRGGQFVTPQHHCLSHLLELPSLIFRASKIRLSRGIGVPTQSFYESAHSA